MEMVKVELLLLLEDVRLRKVLRKYFNWIHLKIVMFRVLENFIQIEAAIYINFLLFSLNIRILLWIRNTHIRPEQDEKNGKN